MINFDSTQLWLEWNLGCCLFIVESVMWMAWIKKMWGYHVLTGAVRMESSFIDVRSAWQLPHRCELWRTSHICVNDKLRSVARVCMLGPTYGHIFLQKTLYHFQFGPDSIWHYSVLGFTFKHFFFHRWYWALICTTYDANQSDSLSTSGI